MIIVVVLIAVSVFAFVFVFVLVFVFVYVFAFVFVIVFEIVFVNGIYWDVFVIQVLWFRKRFLQLYISTSKREFRKKIILRITL